jgi:hypothetical protein
LCFEALEFLIGKAVNHLDDTTIGHSDDQPQLFRACSQMRVLLSGSLCRCDFTANICTSQPLIPPHPNQPKRNGAFIPWLKRRGFPAPVL